MDLSNPSWGILFKFPITVMVPKRTKEDEKISEALNFTISNEIHRFFFIPPPKSRQCIIKVTSLNEKDATLKFHYFSENAQIGDEKTEEIEFSADKKQRTGCLQLDDEDEKCASEICIYQEKEFRQYSKFYLEFEFLGFAKIDSFRILNNFYYLSYLPSCIFKQRLQFRNDLSKIKYSSMSLKFDRIAYRLKARNVKYETVGKKQYLNLEYSLTVSKQSKYKFTLITFEPGNMSEVYSLKRIQIFTLSKKYVSAFGEWPAKTITLQPGIYVIKAVFEYQPSKPLYMQILSSIEKLPEISVKMYFEEPLIPTLNSNYDKNIELDKNETMTVDYDLIFDNDVVPASLPFVSNFKGEFSLKLENTSIDIKVKHKYFNFERIVNETSGLKELCQTYLPYSTNFKNLYNNMAQKEASKWQKNIRSIYLTQNCTKLVETVDAFLEKINYKDFLENYDQIITDADTFERKLFTQQKMIIIEALFLKADVLLNEYLKQGANVAEIFKNDFGNEIITNQILNLTVSKMHQFSVVDICSNFLSHSIFPTQDLSTSYNNWNFLTDDRIQQVPEIREQQDQNGDKDVENFQTQNLHFIKDVCKYFLEANQDQEDIRKNIIVIKQAVLLGNFGTALFHLNKFSTENQTLPDFKIFDQAIIELVKHLNLKDLVEAHENALLDQHRNCYRKF